MNSNIYMSSEPRKKDNEIRKKSNKRNIINIIILLLLSIIIIIFTINYVNQKEIEQQIELNRQIQLEKSEKERVTIHTPIPTPMFIGQILLESTPSDANIYIDDRYYGKTPDSFSLSTGTHSIRLTHVNMYDYETAKIIPSSGEIVHIDAVLSPIPIITPSPTMTPITTLIGKNIILTNITSMYERNIDKNIIYDIRFGYGYISMNLNSPMRDKENIEFCDIRETKNNDVISIHTLNFKPVDITYPYYQNWNFSKDGYFEMSDYDGDYMYGKWEIIKIDKKPILK